MRRLLVDTGPLIAVLDAGDAAHQLCVAWMVQQRGQLMTTWPVVGEAMYMLRSHPQAQSALLTMCESGRLGIADILNVIPRIRDLMEKYRDLPMDFADATLVAVAERERLGEVFTLDNDFHVYRLEDRRAIHVVP